jgi:ribosome-binding protein aMBF1 (putative translation factor)
MAKARRGRPQKKKRKTTNNRGQAMRAARRRLGLTQLERARRVGCTESLGTKIETGRAVPEQPLTEAIAAALQIQSWEVGQ